MAAQFLEVIFQRTVINSLIIKSNKVPNIFHVFLCSWT